MLRIGIDAYELSKFKSFTGISNYLYNILKHLEMLDQENEYFLYNNEDINFPLMNSKWHKRIYYDLFGVSHTVWLNTILVKQLLKDNINIFWQPSGALFPIFMPTKIKTLLTIHDLVLQYYPETMEWNNRLFRSLFFNMSYKRADVVMAISNSTAEDIKRSFPNLVTSKKTWIIQGGVDDKIFRPLDKAESKNFVKTKFKIEKDYILFVGTLEPRKNLCNLIKAFSSLVKYKRNLDHQLVVVGKKGWGKLDISSLLRQSDLGKKEIKFLGYVEIEDLVFLYSAATIFIMPSLYEGFGLPILEAMACGCPVITSNISSMPEVAGKAAVLVNPYNIDEIAKAIYKVIVDGDLRREMQIKGYENTKRFSWDRAAIETLELINSM